MPASGTGREIAAWSKTGRPVPGAPTPDLFTADALDAFARNIVVGVREMTEEAAVTALREQTIKARQEGFANHTQRSGVAPHSRIVIDGVEDAPLSAIKPNSIIVLLWSFLPEVAQATYTALKQRSPRRSGAYIEGLLVFVDGDPAGFQAITIDTREVRFVASVPYARRLEVGKDESGGPFVKQVATHIVEETAIVAKRKFSDLAYISYEYVDLSGAWALSRRGMIPRHFVGGRWRHSHAPRSRGGMLEEHVRYPSILIKPIE